jgi:hypothetical protein
MAFFSIGHLPHPELPPIGRIVFTGNIVELITTAVASGIRIIADYSSSSFPGIKQLIVRKNELRHVDGAAGDSGTIGITITNVDQAIIEENLINIGTTPNAPDNTKAIVRSSTVNHIKTFNNQSSAVVFLACYNGDTARHDGDPVTDMEDSLLGI